MVGKFISGFRFRSGRRKSRFIEEKFNIECGRRKIGSSFRIW